MSEALDPAQSDAEAWIDAVMNQRRHTLGTLASQEQQLARLGVQSVMPPTTKIRKWWKDNQGCCPHCGRELMRKA